MKKPAVFTILTLFGLLANPALFALGRRHAPVERASRTPVPPPPAKGASVEGITEYQLANGMKVLLFPDNSKPTITVNIVYLVGSKHENYGETGMAHLLEHMLYKPTKEKFSGQNGTKTPVDVLNSLGARFNGSTGNDRTSYYISFPATDDNLKTILALEADRMTNARLSEKDLWDKAQGKGEMTVVRNEFEYGENHPQSITVERTVSVAYDWHNYGKSTIGAKCDIENVSIQHLRAFYEKYYQPDNAVLVVAGKIDEANTLGWANEMFGRIPKPKRILEHSYTLDPTQDGERSVIVRRAGNIQLLISAYHIPAGADTSLCAITVLSEILGRQGSGRLYKVLVDTKKVQQVYSAVYDNREPGLLLFGTQFSKDSDPEPIRTAFLETLEQIKKAPITAEEVEKVKTNLSKKNELLFNDSTRMGTLLTEFIALGDWRLFFLHRDNIASVTAQDVQKAAEYYLRPSNRTLGQFIPDLAPVRAEIPPMQDVTALVKDYKGKAAVAKGEDFEATPANIDSRTKRWQAANGMKVAFLDKKTRGESVQFTLVLRMGDETSLTGKQNVGDITASMLMRGTERLNKEKLMEAFDQIKANVTLSGDASRIVLRGATLKPHLADTLKLVGEILQKPAFAKEELERLVNEQILALDSNRREPEAIVSRTIQKHLNRHSKNHVQAYQELEEEISALKALKVEELREFHRTFFGASQAQLAIVGDFDPDQARIIIEDTFGQWKAAKPFARIPSLNFNVPATTMTAETPDKPNAIVRVAQELSLKDTDADYPALLLANRIFGGGGLKSRLMDRIRQREGISYNVLSALSVDSLDAVGVWNAQAIYNPENGTRLEKAFQEEVSRVLKDGFTETEIRDAKKAWMQDQAQIRTQDRNLASLLVSHLYLNRTMAFQADLEKRVTALTPAELNAAFRKHIDPSKFVIAKAGDFAKVGKNQ